MRVHKHNDGAVVVEREVVEPRRMGGGPRFIQELSPFLVVSVGIVSSYRRNQVKWQSMGTGEKRKGAGDGACGEKFYIDKKQKRLYGDEKIKPGKISQKRDQDGD